MRRKLFIAISVIVLVFLVCALVFRYQQIENTTVSETNEKIQRYYDRWTGIEWIKVTGAGGASNVPAKYYNYRGRLDTSTEDVLKDLKRIKNINDVLVVGWYLCTFSVLIFGLYNSRKLNDRKLMGGK